MAAFSPDGKIFVLTHGDGNVATLHDSATGAKLAVLGGHTNTVSNATFIADGNRLITMSTDHTARIWDISGVKAE